MTRVVTWGLLGAVGATAFVIALSFGFGSGSSIGSAPVPLLLSGGIVFVSLWGIVSDAGAEASSLELRPLAAVAAGVLLFILSVEWLGLVPATVVVMFTAYLGQEERRFFGYFVYTILFAGAVWLLFSVGLGLPVGAFGGR